jgi:hypothetical protein
VPTPHYDLEDKNKDKDKDRDRDKDKDEDEDEDEDDDGVFGISMSSSPPALPSHTPSDLDIELMSLDYTGTEKDSGSRV